MILDIYSRYTVGWMVATCESAALAGHWGLGNLVYLYDDNHISIEGDTALAFTEDVGRRFEAYGWQVDRVGAILEGTAELTIGEVTVGGHA